MGMTLPSLFPWRKAAAAPASPPRPLHPPHGDDGVEWLWKWIRSVREIDGVEPVKEPFYDTNTAQEPCLIREHSFVGCATGKRFKWSERAIPTAYSAGSGGLRNWTHQKYHDWEDEPWRPLYLSERLFDEHCYVEGATGSGKTALIITPLLMQMIRGCALVDGRSPLQPIVILDFKGDRALFHTIRAEAAARGQEFKFFNLTHRAPTFRFTPFSGFNPELRSPAQFCQSLLGALELLHGSEYGPGYYTERSRYPLHKALKLVPRVRTCQELLVALRTALRNEREKRAKTDAFELLSKIELLTEYDQLITSVEDETGNRDGIIFVPDVIAKRQIVYFWLPAAAEPISAHFIGGLVLFNLRAAAEDYIDQHPKDDVRTILVIDEFQRVAGDNLDAWLVDIRNCNIRAILANQSIDHLRRRRSQVDLSQVVLTNTAVKFLLSSGNRREFYVFVERGTGLTAPKRRPDRFDPLLREHPIEDFAYRVKTAWPLPRSIYNERRTMPLPGWDEIPGGNWRLAQGLAAAKRASKPAAKAPHDQLALDCPMEADGRGSAERLEQHRLIDRFLGKDGND